MAQDQKKKAIEFHKQTSPALKAVRKVKTDEILTGLDRFEFLLREYWRQITVLIGAVALIIVVLIVVSAVRSASDTKLRREFAEASTAETLETLIRSNPGHPSSFPARARLAAIYNAGNDFRKAAEVLRQIHLSPKANAFLRLQAGMQAAYLIEKAGSDPEALAAFLSLIENPLTTQPRREEAIFAAARLNLKAGKIVQAKALLSRINYQTRTPSLWVEKCRTLQKQLPASPAPSPAETQKHH